MAEQLALQLKDGGSNPTLSLQYFIHRINHGDAKQFVEKWHYSKRMPTGKNVCFGVRSQDGFLYAVIVYGIGVNPYQARYLGVESCVEIKRLCRREPRENYQLSRFINLTTKMLTKEMDFRAVVAFADPEHGHTGKVYSAAGYKNMGETNPEWHLVDGAGNIRHRRYAFRMARRNGISVDKARHALGVDRVKTQPKHRWVRIISEKGVKHDSKTPA
jgi:hypothetical protein